MTTAVKVARLSKGKGIKQSTSIRQNDEPISHKRFEDLAHAILRAVGSWAPKSSLPSMTLDAPPSQTDQQVMVRKEVLEASKPKHYHRVPVLSFKLWAPETSVLPPLTIPATVKVRGVQNVLTRISVKI